MSQTKTTKKSKTLKGKEDLSKYDPLVFAIAKRYSMMFPKIEFEDLVAEGKLGLLEASLKYKNGKKTVFSTYAWFWIIKNIQKYISKNINMIETPQTVKNILSSIKKIIDSNAKSGKKVSFEGLSKALGIGISEVSDTLAIAENLSNIVSLDKEIDTGENIRYLVDSIEDKSQPEIFDVITRSADNEMLAGMLSKLSEKENAVLSFRFALDGDIDKRMSIKDIALNLKVSVAKVKDLENSALLKLKGMIKNING
ncbi:MAG: sigma-70 family RNA polymerase sigma factor [Endomicrobium sp.]|nr:sigma-70 family RNA polymerase sigma factor [Endomicrobium sp.]